MKIKRHKYTSSHWGTYVAKSKGNNKISLSPFEKDKDPSIIGYGIEEILDDGNRITKPMIRKGWLDTKNCKPIGFRGNDEFVQVSWDEAFKIVSGEIQRVINKYGNKSLYAGSYGWASAGRFHHAQSHLKRFLNFTGGFTYSKNTYSFAAAEVLVPHVLGDFYNYLPETTSWDSIKKNSSLVVAFGGIPLKNGQINAGGLGSHEQREGIENASLLGVDFINISPIKSDLHLNKGEWIKINPNSDVALILALAFHLDEMQMVNQSFLDKYTVGYDKFIDYVRGKVDGIPKDANWACKITKISRKKILNLVNKIGKAKRTMISVSWSLTRQDHGEQPFWAAITLASMLGQIGLPGGGVGFGYSAVNSIGNNFTNIRGVSFPQGKNKSGSFIPVARITDMLEKPNETFNYNGATFTYPDIKLIYWAGGNPFHHHQDLNRMIKAWQKPDTIICNEWSWNALAKHSDIILPCTTSLERNDIMLSPRDPYVVYMEKIIDPIGESKSDFEIFCGLAKELGFLKKYSENRSEIEWIKWIYDGSRERQNDPSVFPTFDKFVEKGWFKVPNPKTPKLFLGNFIKNPDKYPLKTPSGKIEIFSEKIDSFNYSDCRGHAKWYEPIEYANIANQFKLHLLSNQPKFKLHSQLDNGSVSQKEKIMGRSIIEINKNDAQSRNITDKMPVRVYNSRGSCLAIAKISSNIMEGVTNIPTGAWLNPDTDKALSCIHGNPNVLTLDKGTSQLAQGPIAHTCLVEIEPFLEELPELTAYKPPIIDKIGEKKAD
ncbi:aspartyl/glutamyl-tRNA(Asn/Gln) amidotransferase subunit C [bacterium TMED277]|nr:MAG: aspartyl/glutamyl-tRNA(Asn/Gln) amidotransferase subunit C [bacterium TMED277]